MEGWKIYAFAALAAQRPGRLPAGSILVVDSIRTLSGPDCRGVDAMEQDTYLVPSGNRTPPFRSSSCT
jgi:hypothetical protein